jgi:hypothetical protein
MGKKKPIECFQCLGGCGSLCVEVGRAIGYPKNIPGYKNKFGIPNIFHEYRYVCPKCGLEFIHDTLFREIARVPQNPQYQIKLINGKEWIETKDKILVQQLGFGSKKRIKLSVEEFKKRQRQYRATRQVATK